MAILHSNLLDEAFKKQINWRDKDSFAYALEIRKPFGALDEVLKWCKGELQNDWRWQMVEMANDRNPGRYIFYFDSEQDYFACFLKWS